MHQRALLELKDKFSGAAVILVLVLRVFNRLSSERVFKFRRRHWNTVQAQSNVETLAAAARIKQLASDGQPVRLILLLRLGIHPMRWLEVRNSNGLSVAFESMSQYIQTTARVHSLA